MAFDAKSAAAEIVRLVGGKENINSVAHCMTRLRFAVKDLKKADQEALKKVPGVLGVIYAGGQLMVVLGKNLLPVYETVVKDFDLLEGLILFVLLVRLLLDQIYRKVLMVYLLKVLLLLKLSLHISLDISQL